MDIQQINHEAFHVELVRVHKSSPYNCSGYLPEVFSESMDTVINDPEVTKMITEAYGKHFIVRVFSNKVTEYAEYEIKKLKARSNDHTRN